MYTLMEHFKSQFCIKEYSCKQATLEQIFNSFAKQDEFMISNRRLTLNRRQTRPVDVQSNKAAE